MGRISIPHEIRKFLSIEEGDLVVIEIKEIKHLRQEAT